MKWAGFTLVELLVALAIISLLLALALPSLNHARDQAMATACQANIKQLYLAFGVYEAAYQRLPYGFAAMRRPAPPSGYLSNPAIDVPGWYWPNYVDLVHYKTLRERRILKCPAKSLGNRWLDEDVLCGNYGVNRSVCRSALDLPTYRQTFEGTPLSTSAVPRPGATLLLVDSGYTLISWWHVRSDPLMTDSAAIADTAYIPGLSINKEREFWQGQANDAKLGRHGGKTVNVGYLDGHAERRKAEDLLVEKGDAENYPNRNPLWEP